ncbi:MAG: septal ring lytic transglycosylase RlpA family protein [Chloroflexi bacterium]|nr:septal ring lytic transglycosylase RlpA family protein [Chloroflexota bacterium]
MRKRLMVAVVVALLASVFTPSTTASADLPLDYDIPNGHFYTQTNGSPQESSPKGFRLTDDDGIPFWSEFQRLGSVPVLGYPISRRFLWDGFVSQATQKAIMQWSASEQHVKLVNILDYLSQAGKDDWLSTAKLVPKPISHPSEEGQTWEEIVHSRYQLLEESPAIKFAYFSVPDPIALFGLPTSPPQDMGPVIAVRFQRAVIQQWKVAGPTGKANDITVANAGDLLKEAGLILPKAALIPEGSPLVDTHQAVSSRASLSTVKGLATWYGANFHGRIMRNGAIYNMYDPTTTACNVFPLGSQLKVTSLDTGKSINVRVTDTGAFRPPIIVDLSWAAFAQLADPRLGILNVIVELLPD